MIIKRKTYSRRDPTPDKFPIPGEWDGEWDSIRYDLRQVDRQYNKDIQGFGPVERKIIKNLRDDLKLGFIYEDGPHGGDTHYLADFSTNKFQRFTKSINSFDRMDYLVYPPILDEESREVVVQVVIQSLKGHTIYGQGTYSDNEMKNID